MTEPWRRRTLQALIALVVIPLCLAFVVAGAFAYARVFELPDAGPLPLPHALGLIATMCAGVWAGYVVGFVAWLLVARYLLRFAREDVKPMISGACKPPVFGGLFRLLFERCFGSRP